MKSKDIYFKCLCGKSLAVDAKGTGITISCPECGQELKVPKPDHKLRCDCGTTMLIPESMVGENIQCLTCKTFWKVPIDDFDNHLNVRKACKGLYIQNVVEILKKVNLRAYGLISLILVGMAVVSVLISIDNHNVKNSGRTTEPIGILDNELLGKSPSGIIHYVINDLSSNTNDKIALENNRNYISTNTRPIVNVTIKSEKTNGFSLIMTNIIGKHKKDIPSQMITDSNSRIFRESEEVEIAINKFSQCTNNQQDILILDNAILGNANATNINKGLLCEQLKEKNNPNIQADNIQEERNARPRPTLRDLSDSLMIIEGEMSMGSGFILLMKDKKYLITNRHVIIGTKIIRAKSLNGHMPKLKSFELGMNADLVRMEIDESEDIKFLIPAKNINLNDPIIVYGNSEGKGVVTEINGVINGLGPEMIETTAGFVSGNSGSPMLNEKGEVLGVATFVTQNIMQDWITKGTRFENVRRFGLRPDSIKWLNVPFNDFYNQNQLLLEAELYFGDLADIIIYCCYLNKKKKLDTNGQYLSKTFFYYLTSDHKKLFKRSRWSNELARFVKYYDNIYKGGLSGKSAYGMAKLTLQTSVTLPKKVLKETQWIDNWFQKEANRHLDFMEYLSSNLDEFVNRLPVPK
jgi:S1-C subfamily serine protease